MADSKVSLNVTLLIRGKQQQYSVPSGEFLRYAQYCTRRIARLTKLLRKDPSAADIKGPKLALDAAAHPTAEHIQIAIFTAERAWARYRYLKNTAEGTRRTAHARRRLAKCQKAWQYAHDCAAAFCTDRTLAEVDAFRAFARATLNLERGEWADAYSTFSEVSAAFGAIGASSSDDTLRGHCEDIQREIDPLLEFCRFNLGQTASTHIDAALREKVRTFVVDTEEAESARQISALSWRGNSIQITQNSLKQKLAEVCDLIEDSQKDGLDADFRLGLYDKIIAQTHSIRQLVRSHKSENEDLCAIDEFLRWNSFVSTISRSQVLMASLAAGADRADFAARTLARIQDAKARDSLFGDDGAVQCYERVWRAQKVMNIALTKIGPESAGLLERAAKYCGEAVERIQSEGIDNPPTLRPLAESLLKAIRKQRIAVVAALAAPESAAPGAEQPFLADLDSFRPCSQIVEVPPRPRTTTPKGMIFDLAADYIDYPSLESKFKKGWASRLKFW